MQKTNFIEDLASGFSFKGDSITLGAGMLDGQVVQNSLVKIPLKTLNRHGLIAGATGTGKTKTLQIIAEQLSNNGVPCLLMDIKGDLSGIAAAAAPNPKLNERHTKIGIEFESGDSPVEFLSLSGEPGVDLELQLVSLDPFYFPKYWGSMTHSRELSLWFSNIVMITISHSWTCLI